MIPAVLTTVLGGVLDKVLEKVTNQLPVTENEKENIRIEAEKELTKHVGAIAEAEAKISSNAKDAWLEELHNGGFLATTWRPLLALSSTFIIFWDGVLINVINAALEGLGTFPLAHTPAYVLEVSMWVLLTLIGARGFEKISVVRTKAK